MTTTTVETRPIEVNALHAQDQPGPTWLRRHAGGMALLVALLVMAGLLHGWNMYQSPGTTATDDEGTYVAQAWALLHVGELANYTYWYDHPPVGWIMLGGYAWLTDGFDRLPAAIMVGREFMLLMKLATVVLLYGLARRLGLSRIFTAIAVVLVAINPLAIYFHRLTFLDNIAVPWMLAAFFLTASPRRRLAEHAAGAICFALAVLVKETLLLLLPALVYVLWQHSARRTRPYALVMGSSLFVMTVLMYPLYAVLKGELFPGEGHVSLWDAIRWQLVERVGSGSIFDPYSPAAGFVGTWERLDLWMLALAAASVPAALFRRRLRPVALVLLIQFITPLRSGGYLPLAHLVAALPFAALMISGTLDGIWRAGHLDSVWRVKDAFGDKRDHRRGSSRSGVAGPVVSVLSVATILLAFGVGVVWPKWLPQVERFTSEQANAPVVEATQWVQQNIERGQIVLVNHGLWVDLVEDGFPSENVIWYYKPDTDPEVSARLPNNWRDIGYIVSNVEMRATVDSLRGADQGDVIATTIAAFDNSTVVASFGATGQEILVHRVHSAAV